METINQLKNEVFATEQPSRELLITYLKALVAEASKLPVPKRDWFAYEILRPFVELGITVENDSDLDYIIFQLVGGELDVNTEEAIAMSGTPADQAQRRESKANTWRELIEQVEQLADNSSPVRILPKQE